MNHSNRLSTHRALLERGRWSSAATAASTGADLPDGSWGHSATWLRRRPAHGDALVVFGGELLTPGVLGSTRARDEQWGGGARLWRLDDETRRWARVAPDQGSAAPPARRQHAAAAWAGALVVSGGMGPSGSAVGDLWTAELSTDGGAARWSASGLEPRWGDVLSRHGHTLVAASTGVLLFGGRMAPLTAARSARAPRSPAEQPMAAAATADGDPRDDGSELTAMNDVWLLEPLGGASAQPQAAAPADDEFVATGPRPLWRMTRLEREVEVGCAVRRVEPISTEAGTPLSTALGAQGAAMPCGRSAHSAHWYVGPMGGGGGGGGGGGCGAGCMLVFGGLSQLSTPLGDLWLYRVKEPRETHKGGAAAAAAAAAADDGPAGWKLVRPAKGSERPPPRSSHAACLWDHGLYVFGGESAAAAASDETGGAGGARGGRLWRFELRSLRWTAMYTAAGGAVPPGFFGATLSAPKAQQPRQEEAEEAEDEETQQQQQQAGQRQANELLLLGGTHAPAQAAGPLVGGMTTWRWVLGVTCWPGCPYAMSCDTEAARCVCDFGAACHAVPLELHASDYGASLSLFGRAWAMVGISCVGALVGATAQRVSSIILKRRAYADI